MKLVVQSPVRTARLMLRPLTVDDAAALVAYRSLPEVCRYVPFEPMDEAAVLAKLRGRWAQTTIKSEGDGVLLGVQRADTAELIGDVGLWFKSAEHRSGELGWMFHPAHSGHGYATEAAQAMLGLAFEELGLHRVVARVDARNEPSLRLCERLGMRREAVLRQNEWFKGAWSDELDFALLEDEWSARRAGVERDTGA